MTIYWKPLLLAAALLSLGSAMAQWKPAKGPLTTRWTKLVSPKNALPEYPRPQLVRKQWLNLNGLWDFAMNPKDSPQPLVYNDQILVPYPVESALSGVMKTVTAKDQIWYKRKLTIPADWTNQRVLLHFGAADWVTTVWVNGTKVGTHTGGYDPFSFEITDALKSSGEQEVVVSVWDPSDVGYQPRGKQVMQPGGCMYTPISGIWQTVWLEPVPKSYIKSLRMVPDIDTKQLNLKVIGEGELKDYKVTAEVPGKGIVDSKPSGEALVLNVKNPKLWSPEHPNLYDLTVTLKDSKGVVVDQVKSYFAMRKVSLGKDELGRTRICLNNKPYFMAGFLDQGFWPDGLYTPPTDDAMKYDIDVTKKFGFNFARKHVKVEPARWYYWCDKLGLVVWQDMPSGDLGRNEESSKNLENEMTAMVEALYNVPSIVLWVVFNEGWGQHDTPKFVNLVRKLDSSRLINNASGWTDTNTGDVIDWHVYPGPASPDAEESRAAVLGEFGGLGFVDKGHLWNPQGSWGYQSFDTLTKLNDRIVELFRGCRALIDEKGMSAIVYTQTSDVETECNGFMTYDREVIKPNIDLVRSEVMKLYPKARPIKEIIRTSKKTAQTWRYTFIQPDSGWMNVSYDDSGWYFGPGGFGTSRTPGSVVRTDWGTKNIWLRRTFRLTKEIKLKNPVLYVHHDEDAEIYLDGKLIARLSGFTSSYVPLPLDPKTIGILSAGVHTIAVHCRQVNGGQYIDVGIADY